MRLHEILARCVDIIRTYDIVQYEVVGLHSRLKLKIVFANGTELHVRDILLDGQQRKYAFHWQDGSGRLIARWDNAAHWPQVAHTHITNTLATQNALLLQRQQRWKRYLLLSVKICSPLEASANLSHPSHYHRNQSLPNPTR